MADQKPFWTGIDRGRNRWFSGRVVDAGLFNKTIILLGLAGYKIIITNSALRATLVTYHFTSTSHPRRIIEVLQGSHVGWQEQ